MEYVKKRVLIITGGIIEVEFAKAYLSKNQFDIVIAADSGLMSADKLGMFPDYIVGDFDSVSSKVMKKYQEKGQLGDKEPIIIEYPPEKDYTDTHIGLELAISLNATNITLLGATGTRIDHLTCNLNLLQIPLMKKVKASIVDAHNKIYLIDSDLELQKEQLFGSYLSLVPFTDEVVGVTLTGFKYPLVKKNLSKGESIGISNEVLEKNASIALEKGILMVAETKD